MNSSLAEHLNWSPMLTSELVMKCWTPLPFELFHESIVSYDDSKDILGSNLKGSIPEPTWHSPGSLNQPGLLDD